MTTISIALATYNGERFLREQLDSLARQTRLPDELVVADDGSTDGTLEIVHAFAAAAPFAVVVLPQEGRLGYRANFMRCASRCTGDLIAFCDQDDIWLPHKLDVQSATLSQPNITLCAHAVSLVDDCGRALSHRFSFFERPLTGSYRELPPFPFALGMTICMKRECKGWDDLWMRSLDRNNVSERMAHDQWYPFVASLIGRISFVAEDLALYRQHSANVTGNRTPVSWLHRLRTKLRTDIDEYDRLRAASLRCADLVSSMHDLPDQNRVPPAPLEGESAACDYMNLCRSFERRLSIARSQQVPQRVGAAVRSVWHGDYRFGSSWHFKPQSILRDLMGR